MTRYDRYVLGLNLWMKLIAMQFLQFWWVRLSLQQTYNQFEGSMSSEDQDCTNDDSQIYDSPPKNTKTQSCPDSSVTEYRHSRMQDLDQMFIKFKEEQTQIVSHKIKQLQKNRKQSIVVVVIVISLLLIPIYVLDSQVKQLSFRVNELQYREKELLSEVKQLQVGLTELNQMDQALQSSLLNINQEILDLHMNELLKEEKSMLILQKYTSSFDFSIDFKNTNFKDNFAEDAASRLVRKRSGQEVMFYSKQPIPNAGVYYFKVKVEETELGMIGIGIMPAQKRNQKCVYCDSSQIYYIYCKNAQIYNGEFFNLVNKSKKSKFSTIESGDTLTIFVDTKKNQVTWYVNSQYAGSQTIKESNKEWYPFVQMTTRGDQVKFVD